MNDMLIPVPTPEVVKLLRIAVGLHIQSLPQMKGKGASKDRRQIERAIDRFAENVAATFFYNKVVMQKPAARVFDEAGQRIIGGAVRTPGEVIYKRSAMLAVRHEKGFAVVELLQDVDSVAVGDAVEGVWRAVGEQRMHHKGQSLDAYCHETHPVREDALRSAEGNST